MPLADDAGITMHQYNLREYQEGWREYNIEFTPTLVYFENGAEKERMVGGLKPEGSSEGYPSMTSSNSWINTRERDEMNRTRAILFTFVISA